MSEDTTDQQAGDTRDQQDPYPADQQFGAAAARDQEAADAGGGSATTEGFESTDDGIEVEGGATPRAGNKAETED